MRRRCICLCSSCRGNNCWMHLFLSCKGLVKETLRYASVTLRFSLSLGLLNSSQDVIVIKYNYHMTSLTESTIPTCSRNDKPLED